MNETIKTILKRRSHRTFKDGEVTKEELDKIIEAGLYAPSAFNQQPWHFTVIQNKEILDELNYETKEIAKKSKDPKIQAIANSEKYNMFYNAPVAIIVSCEEEKYEPLVDCAVATENMILAAESLNLGSCWIGFIGFLFKGDKEKASKYAKILQIPEGFAPSHAVIVGHKKIENLKAPKRRENTVNYIL